MCVGKLRATDAGTAAAPMRLVHWSVWVNGNWRLTFRFVGKDAELVDYQDYR